MLWGLFAGVFFQKWNTKLKNRSNFTQA